MEVDFRKEIGESMSNLVKRFKEKYPECNKITYAGRLDPMAMGLVKILTGDLRFKRESYTNSDKIYQYKVIEGLSTDTYDILGLVTGQGTLTEKIVDRSYTFLQPYPPFSSQTILVEGKKVKMWEAYKSGEFSDQKVPTKQVTVYYTKKLGVEEVTNQDLLQIVKTRLEKLQDPEKYRRDEILQKWEDVLKGSKIWRVSSYETKISSGGYIRSLVNEMGGVALDINRISYSKIV